MSGRSVGVGGGAGVITAGSPRLDRDLAAKAPVAERVEPGKLLLEASRLGGEYCRDLFDERIDNRAPFEEHRELLVDWCRKDDRGSDGLGDIAHDEARRAGVDMDDEARVDAWVEVFCASFYATCTMLLASVEAMITARDTWLAASTEGGGL